ncbi:MAG: polynucleotide adenylyltransferase PcnB [Kangiellaceae bacterium]|nr:polynucleotide adenylyltransferase PcnB [Kangiellaceae bacterium]
MTKEIATNSQTDSANARVLSRDAHSVSRKNISNSALKVLYRLNEAGYEAYLVGGGVRDILLGLQPKDFDVATDATPEEVQKVFRNCRLIGRRFRLAHILFGREVIEVATFRANHDSQPNPTQSKSSKNDLSRTSDHGMLMRDNVYGNIVEDAFRRDFTINALYYTVKDFSVIDYTHGLEDLAARKLRLIGEPEARYREDPVRILRAIRLACKLSLDIEKETAKPIKQLAELLSHVSSARLWDESNKMLLAGHAQSTWNMLHELGVAKFLFPDTIQCLEDNAAPKSAFSQFIQAALKSTDSRIANKLPVTPAFLFAVVLWEPINRLSIELKSKGMPAYEASQRAATRVMEKQRQVIGIPKRFSMVAKEIWALQHRLHNRRKKSVFSLIAHPRFRAAYDFLCLRAGDDAELNKLADWWTRYQELNAEQRNQFLNEVEHSPNKPKRRKPTNKSKTKQKQKRANGNRSTS